MHFSQESCPPLSVGTVRIWHSSTYRLESTLNYGMERVWCVCGLRGSNNVALGYDEGSIIIKVSGMKTPHKSSIKIKFVLQQILLNTPEEMYHQYNYTFKTKISSHP